MKLAVETIIPRPEIINTTKLKKTGLLSKQRLYPLPPEKAVLLCGQNGTEILIKNDTFSEECVIEPSTQILTLSRSFGLTIRIDGIVFNGSCKGSAILWAKMRFIATEQTKHPLLTHIPHDIHDTELHSSLVKTIVAAALNPFLPRQVTACLKNLDYGPALQPEEASALLKPIVNDIRFRKALKKQAGLDFDTELGAEMRFLEISVPELDDLEKNRKELARQKRRDAERHRQALTRIEQEKELAAAHNQKKLQQEQYELQRRLQQAEAKAKQEQEQLQTAMLEKEVAIKDAALSKEQAAAKREQLKTEHFKDYAAQQQQNRQILKQLNAQINDLKNDIQLLNTRPPLSLLTNWSSYNRHGSRTGQLSQCAEVEGGCGLDVLVTSSEDAWIYIVNYSNDKTWQLLLPESQDEKKKIMHLQRSNFQKKGQQCYWPGENNHPQGRTDLPYWTFVGKPCKERLFVLASTTPLDIERLMEKGYLSILLEEDRGKSRTIFNNSVVVEEMTLYHV